MIDDITPTSTSGSIDFEFSTVLDGLPTTVDGFICELDGTGAGPCPSGSISFDGLLPGSHTFEVFAFTGDVEDPTSVDPTPATFTWAIIPDTVIESAIDGNGDDLIAEIDPINYI